MGGDKLKLTPVRYGMEIRASYPNSPYPTPIALNDDMQTPATIYSSYQETSATGKRARIRVQYVYPASKPAHRLEISSGIKSVELENENEAAGEFSFGTKKNSEETPKVLVSGLSGWLKPTTALRGRNGIPNSTTKYKEVISTFLQKYFDRCRIILQVIKYGGFWCHGVYGDVVSTGVYYLGQNCSCLKTDLWQVLLDIGISWVFKLKLSCFSCHC